MSIENTVPKAAASIMRQCLMQPGWAPDFETFATAGSLLYRVEPFADPLALAVPARGDGESREAYLHRLQEAQQERVHLPLSTEGKRVILLAVEHAVKDGKLAPDRHTYEMLFFLGAYDKMASSER